MRAIWQDDVLAESDRTILVEGVHYFPPESIRREYFTPSDTRTICPWKGEAVYYSVTVGDHVQRDAAWTYPDPLPRARHFKDYMAFWRGVRVVE
jgi:uncharacterized protein (DUF427 family)